jgi:regulator of sigma E protease
MLTILSFIVVIGVIIFVHELGHFLAAKSVGIRVETFSLGYPPKMVGRRHGETEYCIGWVPLGGYVKMSGMIDESMHGGEAITGAPWEFMSKNAWQKLWVISAGVLMNLLLGVLVYTGIAATKGIAEPSESPVIGELTSGWPAEQAGLQPGDRVVAIDGTPIATWNDILEQIRPRGGRETAFTYAREGQQLEAMLTPRLVADDGGEAAGQVGKIGIAPEIVFRAGSVGEVLLSGVVGTANIVALVGVSVWKLVTLQVSVRDLGGPLLIAKLSGDSARQGIAHFLSFIAFISINIGCFNLLPIPALDGGHALIITGEAITRRTMPTRARLALQQVGMLLLLALVVVIVINDAHRIFGFEWLKRIF